MSVLQEHAIELLSALPDDRVEIIIRVMQGFIEPIDENKVSTDKRIGVAKGMFVVPDDIDECNEEIAEMFGVS